MALAGISAEELNRYKNPAAYADQGGAVTQPDVNGPGPHMSNYPEGAYERIMAVPDEAILHSVPNEPPVAV